MLWEVLWPAVARIPALGCRRDAGLQSGPSPGCSVATMSALWRWPPASARRPPRARTLLSQSPAPVGLTDQGVVEGEVRPRGVGSGSDDRSRARLHRRCVLHAAGRCGRVDERPPAWSAPAVAAATAPPMWRRGDRSTRRPCAIKRCSGGIGRSQVMRRRDRYSTAGTRAGREPAACIPTRGR